MDVNKENFEKNCCWHFARQLGGSDSGPNEAMGENFKKTPYASLVREAIQNSLDAVDDESIPVTVCFQFKEISSAKFPRFFELKENVDGCLRYYKDNQNAKDKYGPMADYLQYFISHDAAMPYLTVSDSNTKGMDYIEGDTNCPFYAFVQSVGVTSKGGTSAGGSFGFGKAAYFGVSKISTILVSTKTKQEKYFFEGISSLCTHEKDGVKRMAVGYYDNNNGRPIVSEKNIPNRFLRKGGAGTDIYIMGIDTAFKEDIMTEMLYAVLRNFWLSIYKNKLIVRIEEVTKEKSIRNEITRDNLADWIERKFMDLVDTNNRSTYNPRPYFDAVRFANTRNEYRLFEKCLPVLGQVHFYTFRNKDANDRISYMRAPLMLIYAKKYQMNYGSYGVFVCDDSRGNEILRKLENPAHNEWNENNWQLNGKTVPTAKEAIKERDVFIKECVSELFKTEGNAILKIAGLENYLYIPTAMEEDDEENMLDETESQEDENNSFLSVQSELSSSRMKQPQQSPSMGKVLMERKVKARVSSDGNLYSGHSGKASLIKGGGAGSRKLDMRNVLDEKGKPGSYAEPIFVKYRTFAQRRNEFVQHHIIVYSDVEVENGKISLVIAGEQEDDKINIIYTNKGKAYQNVISHLHFITGRNEIIVRLSDNMKHAIKLEVYESK